MVRLRSGTLQYARFGEVPRLLLFQTADLLLFVAVLPVLATATMVGIGLARRAAESHRLFSSVALPTVGAVLGSAISVSSTYVIDGSQEINERYVMYLAPILLVGLAVWIEAGLPRPRWVLGVVLGCVLLGALLPFDRLEVDARYYAPALCPGSRSRRRGHSRGSSRVSSRSPWRSCGFAVRATGRASSGGQRSSRWVCSEWSR